LPTTLTVVAGHGLAGLWTPSVIELYAYALPAMVLGLFLGGRLSRFLPRGLFDRAIYAFLIVMGLLLVLQA
jgi:uncharacterized membrane protein YfcA